MKRVLKTQSFLSGLAIMGLAGGLLAIWTACSTAPTPFVVQGPGSGDNEPPTLTILEPVADQTIDQGKRFLIRWTDGDRDSNALINFLLVNTQTNQRILLVEGIEENDISGQDSVSIGTSPVPTADYNLLGVISDAANPDVEAFAMTTGDAVPRRAVLTISPPGTGPPTRPPTVTVTNPVYNLSVAQDDELIITVQPTELVPNDQNPYDPDSDMNLFILLDTDENPNNDDPGNDLVGSDDGIILLGPRQVIQAGRFDELSFPVIVDLRTIPPRPDGQPYFVRATVEDGTNPRVHRYASGKISVVELAAGLVDLAEVGKTKAGARWYGFNPGASTGSSMSTIGDFDGDGISDFVIVAQFGNPRNFGPVGEAYVVYGLNGTRFGGAIPVNSIGELVSGVILEGPPIRLAPFGMTIASPTTPRSDGITSVSFIRDVTADGRPDILIGMPHVHGAFESMDWDPGDDDPSADATEEVTIVFTQGRLSTTEGDDEENVTDFYSGVDDTSISSADPTLNLGSSSQLVWRDAPTAREWTLIKFKDILNNLPPLDRLFLFLIDTASIDATLELRVFDPGAAANVHQLLSDFDEQTTFSTFGGGGPPEAGVDYETVALAGVSGTTVETVNIDVGPVVQQLIEGALLGQSNELRFIIVPNTGEADQAAVRSSEFGTVQNRPTLRMSYTRLNFFGASGCYADELVNNVTNSDNLADLTFYYGGFATMLNSQNRDNESVTGVNVNRLESTTVSIELIGQEGIWELDEEGRAEQAGVIFARADNRLAENRGNEAEEGPRISGSRFVAGGFDFWDDQLLRQGPREGLFGQTVASIGDLNNDGLDEIVISAPRNERYLEELENNFGPASTQRNSTLFQGSITVIPGENYNLPIWRDTGAGEGTSTSTTPVLDQQRHGPEFGSCTQGFGRHLDIPRDTFGVFAEDVDDMLGGAGSAGDFNQDGLDDILCGAYLNDRSGRDDTGAAYILYGRNVLGDFKLENADNVLMRTPMLRIRGVTVNDQVGWRQSSGLDVNGDRIDDVFIAAPRADFGGVSRASCGGDFNHDGVVNMEDFNSSSFESCRARFRRNDQDLFSDDTCKVFDYDNDDDIDEDDRCVFCCLSPDCDLADTCVLGREADCCANLVDNGFVGIVFGGVFTDGDRDITQIGSSDLAGAVFFGAGAGDRAGFDISSAGDFNQDGFGDLLIVAPGETRFDRAGRQRLGVVYLIFGGTRLTNTEWSLSQVGTVDLPGIVFVSPYVEGRPNEAPPASVAFLGDVNRDGFGDIAIGIPKADFIDLSFPQGPDAPSGDAAIGRRRNAGDCYLVYGNNFGTNRSGQ